MAVPMFRSPAVKMLLLAALSLLLLIPFGTIRGLIHERQQRALEVESSIAVQWGGAQVIGGAYLSAQVRQTDGQDQRAQIHHAEVVLLPDLLDIEAELSPEVRKRGIFALPVYTTTLKVQARFDPEQLAALRRQADPDLPLQLRVALSDARGLRAVSELRVGDDKLRLAAARRGIAELSTLGADLAPAQLDGGGSLTLSFEIEAAGARSLSWLPLGRTTRVHLRAPWRDPSFDGAYLPTRREVSAGGFDARWQVLEFSRPYPQSFALGSVDAGEIRESAFGLSLFQPAGLYQQNERSGKYGMLMIALVFTALFLFEALLKLSLHPIQYGLVGLALATFYLLLLALSEHVGFGAAYAIATVAAVLLVGGYARAVLDSSARALLLAGLQAGAYGVFFVLVKSEDYALLLGASALFVVLGLIMYLTRRTDWSALSIGVRAAQPEPPSAVIE